MPYTIGILAKRKVCKDCHITVEGSYYSAELGTEYKFAVNDGALEFHHRKMDSATLEPAFEDAFLFDDSTIVFSRDDQGGVTGFKLSDGRVWDVSFKKMAH